MNKLTREQADWLIDKLSENSDIAQYTNEIDEIINQCTEKKFPYVWVDLYNGWSIVVRQDGELMFLETLCDGATKQVSASFDRKDFKKLAKGFAQIVEWMNNE